MAESPRFPEHDLDHALQDLAALIDYPPTPDLTSVVRQRIQQGPGRPSRLLALRAIVPAWQRLAAAVIVALILGGAILLAASPSVRTGVADRLGLRGVQIVVAPSPTAPAVVAASPTATPRPTASHTAIPSATPGLSLGFGKSVTLEQARARVTYPVLVPDVATLRSPDAVYLDETPPGGMVSLVWQASPDLPALPNTDVGLVINEFQGSLDRNLFVKMADPSENHVVTVNGATGYWIAGGPHYVAYRDANGDVQFQPDRLAGNTLLWEQGGLTFRLESQLSESEALQIAASMR
jgi:hypothetical protein